MTATITPHPSMSERDEVLAAYRRALEPYRDVFITGPDMGTFPADFAAALEGPPPLWAQSHEGVDMDDLATGHGVKAAAEAALAHGGLAGALARDAPGPADAHIATDGPGGVDQPDRPAGTGRDERSIHDDTARSDETPTFDPAG